MSTWRKTWWTAAGLIAAAGALGTPGVMGTWPALTMLVMMALSGAGIGWAFTAENTDVRRSTRLGMWLVTAPFLVPGLVHLLGPVAWVLVGGVLVTSPPSVWLVRRFSSTAPGGNRNGGATPASPDDGLRREWLESTRQLREAASDGDRLLIVEARAQILDDLSARHGGRLPRYVWVGAEAPKP